MALALCRKTLTLISNVLQQVQGAAGWDGCLMQQHEWEYLCTHSSLPKETWLIYGQRHSFIQILAPWKPLISHSCTHSPISDISGINICRSSSSVNTLSEQEHCCGVCSAQKCIEESPGITDPVPHFTLGCDSPALWGSWAGGWNTCFPVEKQVKLWNSKLKALLGFSGFLTMDANEARMWLMFISSFSASGNKTSNLHC